MNALADAAFLSSNGPAMEEHTTMDMQALRAMGLNGAMGQMLGASPLPTALSSAVMMMPGRSLMPAQQLPGPGRHLQACPRARAQQTRARAHMGRCLRLGRGLRSWWSLAWAGTGTRACASVRRFVTVVLTALTVLASRSRPGHAV